MFDATKSKFRDVEFRQLDIDDASNADLVQRYGVRGIPRVVFLDASGNVLFNGSPSRSPEGFEQSIQRFR